jgi:hypothetical protein
MLAHASIPKPHEESYPNQSHDHKEMVPEKLKQQLCCSHFSSQLFGPASRAATLSPDVGPYPHPMILTRAKGHHIQCYSLKGHWHT